MSPDDAQGWLREWSSGLARRAEAAAALGDRVAGLASVAEGLDGAVRVRVDSAGRLTGLELAESVRDLPAAELAEVIVATAARAQYGLRRLVAKAVAATVGADSEAGRGVLEGFARRFPDPDRPRGD
jgi:hypothetical protein